MQDSELDADQARLYISRRGEILDENTGYQILSYVLIELESPEAVFVSNGREHINLDMLDSVAVGRIMKFVKARENHLRPNPN